MSESSTMDILTSLHITNVDLQIESLYWKLSADKARVGFIPAPALKVQDHELSYLTAKRYCVICSHQYCKKHSRINKLFESCELIRIHHLARDIRDKCMKSSDFRRQIL